MNLNLRTDGDLRLFRGVDAEGCRLLDEHPTQMRGKAPLGGYFLIWNVCTHAQRILNRERFFI